MKLDKNSIELLRLIERSKPVHNGWCIVGASGLFDLYRDFPFPELIDIDENLTYLIRLTEKGREILGYL